MSRSRAPLVVLDVRDPVDLEPIAAMLRDDGWDVVEGLERAPLDRRPRICQAILRDGDGCAAAVLTAAFGHGLLVGIGALDAGTRERLLDDLSRIAPLLREAPPRGAALEPEVVALLDLLAAGRTLGDAAREVHLSRRTADRRLAEARRLLGADTTAAAIARWSARRLGG